MSDRQRAICRECTDAKDCQAFTIREHEAGMSPSGQCDDCIEAGGFDIYTDSQARPAPDYCAGNAKEQTACRLAGYCRRTPYACNH